MEKSTIFKIVILVLVVLSIILGGSTVTLKLKLLDIKSSYEKTKEENVTLKNTISGYEATIYDNEMTITNLQNSNKSLEEELETYKSKSSKKKSSASKESTSSETDNSSLLDEIDNTIRENMEEDEKELAEKKAEEATANSSTSTETTTSLEDEDADDTSSTSSTMAEVQGEY